jgi:hypothetical protein
MEQSEAIAMLKSLIANIEAGHTVIVETRSENPIGSLCALTLVMNGIPQIKRVDE